MKIYVTTSQSIAFKTEGKQFRFIFFALLCRDFSQGEKSVVLGSKLLPLVLLDVCRLRRLVVEYFPPYNHKPLGLI